MIEGQLDLASTLRDRGADGALDASGEWAGQAWAALRALAASGREFTADDLRQRVGAPPSLNALGSVVLNGLRAGLIVNVGWDASGRASAHRRRVGVYRGTKKAASGG